MNSTATPASTGRPLTTKWSRIVLGIVLLVLVLVLLLPSIIKKTLITSLENAGAEAVHVGDIDLGRDGITVSGLRVFHGGQTIVHAQRLQLQPQWRSLGGGHINLKRIDLHGALLRIQQDADGHWGLPGLGPGEDPAEPQDEPPLLGIDQLYLTESRLLVVDPNISREVHIQNITLRKLHQWRPEQDSYFAAHLSGARGELKLRGSARPLAADGRMIGAITWDGVDLGELQKWLHTPVADSDPRRPRIDLSRLEQQPKPREAPSLKARARIASDFEVTWKRDRDTGAVRDWVATGTSNTRLSDTLFTNEGVTLSLGKLDLHSQYQLTEAILELDGNLDLTTVSGEVHGENRSEFSTPAVEWRGKTKLERQSGRLDLNGLLKASRIELKDPRQSVSLNAFSWQGQLTSYNPADLVTRSQVAFKGLKLEQPSGQAGLGQIQWKGDLRLRDQQLDSQQSEIKAQQIDINQPQQSVQLAQLDWRGSASVELAGAGIDSKGNLDLSGIRARLDGQESQQSVEQRSLHWQGEFSRNNANEMNIRGELSGEQLAATQSPRQHALSVQQFAINKLALMLGGNGDTDDPNGSGSANEIRVSGLNSRYEDNHISLDTLGLQQLAFALPTDFSVAATEVNGLEAELIVASDSPEQPQQAAANKAKTGAEAEAETVVDTGVDPVEQLRLFESLNLFLGKLSVKQSQVTLSDPRLDPPFETRLNNLSLELGSIDSKTPKQPSNIVLRADIGEFGKLDLDGQILPLLPTSNSVVKAKVRALNLLDLNPFLRAELDDEVESGSLNVDTDFTLKAGILDVDNALTIHQMALRPNQTRDKKEGGGSLLDSALSLLQDSSGTIEMKLPITGRFDDPDFDISDAINQAMAKSIATGVLIYLQPLGTLIAVGKLVSDEFSTLRFNPVAFAASNSQLDAEARSYLDELSSRLTDRPGIHIKVCGVAVESDREALLQRVMASRKGTEKTASGDKAPVLISDEQLLAMARQRASSVRRYLTDKGKLENNRLVDCAPRFDAAAGAQPEVRMGQ